jgi:5-methylcytosine-specific restriction endonuclease McrA
MRNYGSVSIVSRKSVLTIQDGLDAIRSETLVLQSIAINLKKDRYKCFLHNGISCSGCNKVASFFAVEKVESKSYSGYSLNLYSDDGSYFTKDHIFPKSLGGADSMDNYQTMCWKCNAKKGNSIL